MNRTQATGELVNQVKKVLIVEDDTAIADAIGYRLRAVGYEVTTAADAVYAIQHAVEETPDVAVLDINLPGGNGLLVAERLMQSDQTDGIPVIFITASKKPKHKERAGELNAVAFLEKPFSSVEMMDAIDKATSPRLPRHEGIEPIETYVN